VIVDVTQLGYLGIESTHVDDWRWYGGDFLGMQPTALGAGHLALRMDERSRRLIVHPSARNGMAYFGFELADAAALARAAARARSFRRASARPQRAARPQRPAGAAP
jgi:hypothetical protein